MKYSAQNRGKFDSNVSAQQYQITAQVWLYSGKVAWHFVTLPQDESDKIKFFTSHASSAFDSVRVLAKIGKTSWKTSLFPDKKTGAYLLPLKSEIRKKEKIEEGDIISATLAIQ